MLESIPVDPVEAPDDAVEHPDVVDRGVVDVLLGIERPLRGEEVAAQDLSVWLQASPHRTRGEFVLMVHPQAAANSDDALSPAALRTLDLLLAELPVKTAVRLAADIAGAPRNALYQAALERRSGQDVSDA